MDRERAVELIEAVGAEEAARAACHAIAQKGTGRWSDENLIPVAIAIVSARRRVEQALSEAGVGEPT